MISAKSLKLFRLKNNYSQHEMAELLEISQSSYNRLENDKREIKISDIEIMANNLGLNPVGLFRELCGEEFFNFKEESLIELKKTYDLLIKEKDKQIEILNSILNSKIK